MWKSNKKRFPFDRRILKELSEMNYSFHEFMPWHFRVWKDKEEKFLDIFPTTRTFCLFRKSNYVQTGSYDDLIETVERKLDDFAK